MKSINIMMLSLLTLASISTVEAAHKKIPGMEAPVYGISYETNEANSLRFWNKDRTFVKNKSGKFVKVNNVHTRTFAAGVHAAHSLKNGAKLVGVLRNYPAERKNTFIYGTFEKKSHKRKKHTSK